MPESFADLSHHNSTVDLAVYAAAGYRRVIHKATEGTDYVDPTFSSRWREAGRLGLARVAYHFARAKFNGADEFDHLAATVAAAGGLGPRDRLCLDTEDTETPQHAKLNAIQFTNRAISRGYSTGLIYTGKWYADPNGITSSIFPPGWRGLWLSDYTPGQADEDIELPAGWSRDDLVARQYSSTATAAGIGTCDMSRVLNDWLPMEGSDDMPLTDADLDAVWTHDVRVGDVKVPAYQALDGAYTLSREARDRVASVQSDVAAVRAKLETLSAGGATVDLDALAAKVADLLAARLAQ